jgi:CHAD domain-containing protein
MGYKLKHGEGIASGVARVMDEQLKGAIAQLEGRGDSDLDEAVHDTRKRLKKTRSAMRLVRDDLGDRHRRRENARLRDAGRRLSGVRDAQVLLETLASLEGDLPAAARRRLAAALEERRRRLADEAREDGGATEEVARELAAVRKRIPDWPLSDESFEPARAGLLRIHRRGRQAMAAALEEGTDEAWHAWRKRVKDLWYVLRILEPVSPTQLGGLVKEADELSDLLGDHNDLAVLLAAVDEHARELGAANAEQLRTAVMRRRDRLRRAAVPLGRRLYTERPKGFADRLAACWEARQAEEAVNAVWLDPETAEEVRRLLAAKEKAKGTERRRLGNRLRDVGFRVSELAEKVDGGGGAFTAADFDALLERGVIRVGTPPAPASL